MRKVDLCNHIFPKPYWDRLQMRAGRNIDIGHYVRDQPILIDLDERLRIMDLFDDYEQVLSLAPSPLEELFSQDAAIDMAHMANDGLAQLADSYPRRFPGFVAALPMASPDAAVAEIFRAVKALGALGIQVYTDVAGRPIDHEDYFPIFRAAYELDIPMILHPGSTSQHDTSIAQGRLVVSGVLDALPGIKIVTHHMGGMIPLMNNIVGPSSLPRLKKPHAEYGKDFYADTAQCSLRDTLAGGIVYHPRDRVLFATDAPFDRERAISHIRETIRLIDNLTIDADWKQDIFWRNAAKIMSFDRRDDIAPAQRSTPRLAGNSP
jgi:predicted TIM-barrel fold metal-dependent hydrolase